jgi:AFG3 family protein
MLPEERQNQKNSKPPFLKNSGNDDKSGKKGPKFSIYWIYAAIAVILLGFQYFNTGSDALKTDKKSFLEQMYKTGDAEKIYQVRNKLLVRVFIKQEALSKDYYQAKFKNARITGNKAGPHFEFKVTSWDSWDKEMDDYQKLNSLL